MSRTSSIIPERLQRLASTLPSVTATNIVSGMQKVTTAVMTHGAVVVTKHDQPTMVLMSVDRYLELEQASEPDLDLLSRQFDEMYAGMQGRRAAKRMSDAFAMSPDQLGAAAVEAAT